MQRIGIIQDITPEDYLEFCPPYCSFYSTQGRERNIFYPCYRNNFGAKLDKHMKYTKEALVYCCDPRKGIKLCLKKQVRRNSRK